GSRGGRGDGWRHSAGTVGTRRDAESGGPPARHRRAEYLGDQRYHLSAPRWVLCLPAARDPAPQRSSAAAGGLSRALREYGPQAPGSRRQHWVDPTGGPGTGNRAAAGALGAGQGRGWAGSAAQRRSGDWQIASRPGADGARRRRAPGVADAVSMFTILPKYRL